MKKHFILLLSFLISLSIFGYFFTKYAVNVANTDDYVAAYDTFWQQRVYNDLHKGLSPNLFGTLNEHIIFYTRITALLLYKVLKNNFSLVQMMALGNLAWFLGIALMAYVFKTLTKAPSKWLSFFPILGFSLQIHENFFWGMASSQNLTVILFCLVSLYCFCKNNTKYFYIGIVFAAIACLTSTTAIAFLLACNLLLVYNRRFRETIILSSFTLLAVFVIFLLSPQHTRTVAENTSFLSVFRFIGAIGHLTGTGFMNFNVPIIIGILILGISFWGFTKQTKVPYQLQFFFGILLFILILAVLFSVRRDAFSTTISRYKNYSVLAILSVIPIIYVSIKEHQRNFVFSILFGLVLIHQILTTIIYSYDIRKNYEFYSADIYNLKVNKSITDHFTTWCNNTQIFELMTIMEIPKPNDVQVDKVIKYLSAIKSAEIFNKKQPNTSFQLNTSFKIDTNIVGCRLKKLNITATTNKISPLWKERYYLVFSSLKKHYLYSFIASRNDLGEILKGNNLLKPQFERLVYLQYLEPNEYRLSILKEVDGVFFLETMPNLFAVNDNL